MYFIQKLLKLYVYSPATITIKTPQPAGRWYGGDPYREAPDQENTYIYTYVIMCIYIYIYIHMQLLMFIILLIEEMLTQSYEHAALRHCYGALRETTLYPV